MPSVFNSAVGHQFLKGRSPSWTPFGTSPFQGKSLKEHRVLPCSIHEDISEQGKKQNGISVTLTKACTGPILK